MDTQDFSRFGDVLRGKGDPEHEELLLALEALRASGDVVFPTTMPIMSELLQYDPDHLETTIKKAEAVERLCGSFALPAPMRLIAMEIARAGGDPDHSPNPGDMLSSDRLWFPLTDDWLANLRDDMHAGAIQSLERNETLSEASRQKAASIIATVDWGVEVEALAPKLADQVGLPIESIQVAVIPFLKGEIDSWEASRRIIASVSEPVAFVRFYLGKPVTGAFPKIIKNVGSLMATQLAEIRDHFGHLRTAKQKKVARALLAKVKPNFATMNVRLAKMAAAEFGLTEQMIDSFTDTGAIVRIPSSKTVIEVLEAYALQVMGITAGRAKIEESFGGDLWNALYIPYVDLWRGDRRFSTLVRQALPAYRERVVTKPRDLLAAIARLQSTRERKP